MISALYRYPKKERRTVALATLRAARAVRPRPLLDDKIVTANNGLMISALAKAAQVLGGGGESGEKARAAAAEESARHEAAAVRAAEFVGRELFDPARGVLYRSWRAGRGAAEGFAEDYAYFIQGLLDLYEASFGLRWLQWAEALQTKMDELFWDGERGGYFNSAAGDASIVLRLKEDYDGAEPAPSSVAAMNLLRLGALGRDEARRERGVRCLEAFRATWSRTPHGLPQMLCALELALEAPRHVVLAGDPAAEDFRALAAVLHEKLGPRRTIVRAEAALPWTAAMHTIDGHAAAYVCEDFTCQLPVTKPAALRRAVGTQ
jgi:hypothetical protein